MVEDTIKTLVANAKKAVAEIADYSQEQVDAMLYEVAKTIYQQAESLAEEAILETRLGLKEHKIAKNQAMATNIYNHLKDKKSVGVIAEYSEQGLIEIAHPVGVIGSVTPTTNPTITPLGNGLMALKGKNALIVSPHPRAKKITKDSVELMRDALEKVGAPRDLLQVIEEPTIELSQELMKQVDLIVATGGPGLVQAAYSSGTPAYGVGPGNVQGILDREFDLAKAAELTIIGRGFDNGIVCACQQSLMYPRELEEYVWAALSGQGAHIITKEEEVKQLREALFPDGRSNPNLVGQSATVIASAAGIPVKGEPSILVVKVTESGSSELLNKEKLNPVLVVKAYDTFEEAVADTKANLMFEGAGHSAGIFSTNQEHILLAGKELPISRLIVNQPTIDAGGSPANGLNPTVSLGCGSWGNNIISENLTYKHLINVSRIAAPIEPTDALVSWE